MLAVVGAPVPSCCFFKIRNRAGLFLNSRFTCVAECLERMVVARGVMVVDDDDDVVMAKKLFACRPMAGVLFVTDLATPKRDIFLFACSVSIDQSTCPPTCLSVCCYCCEGLSITLTSYAMIMVLLCSCSYKGYNLQYCLLLVTVTVV